VRGAVAPGFDVVREAFERLLADGVESGAAGAAFHEGRMPSHDLARAYATTRIGDYDRALSFEASLLAALGA
jgi:hypothetical protein